MLSPFREPAIKQFRAEGVEEAIRLEPALRALGAEANVALRFLATLFRAVNARACRVSPSTRHEKSHVEIARLGMVQDDRRGGLLGPELVLVGKLDPDA